MNNLKKITLNNGTILQIRGDMVTCYDSGGNQKDLTRGQQKLLSELAADLNCTVPMSHLYTAYSGEMVLVNEKGIKENVAKMKVTLPEFIRESIKSVRGVGYTLVGEVIEEHGSDFAAEQSEDSPDTANRYHRKENQLADLIGEYYGYYLDPLGTGTVLGAYIRIENVGTKGESRLQASSVLGIRSEQVLLCDELSAVFSKKGSSRREAYKEFKKTLSNNDQRCSWWQGNVVADGTQAIIDL